jgi:hypothetical protein
MRILATGTVYVCLTDASGNKLLDGVTLQGGGRTRTFTSRRLHARFGNANAKMRVAGHLYPVAQSSKPVDYELRPGHHPRRLPQTTASACR